MKTTTRVTEHDDPGGVALAPGGDRLAAIRAALERDPERAAAAATAALERPPSAAGRAELLLLRASAEERLERLGAARASLLEACTVYREVDDVDGSLDALLRLGWLEHDRGDPAAARDHAAAACALARRADRGGRLVDGLNLEASALGALGRYPEALAALERSLGLARRAGDERQQARALCNVGLLHTALGDYPQALENLTEANELLGRLEPGSRNEAGNLIELGRLYLEMEDGAKAAEYFERAREVGRAAGEPQIEAAALNNLGNVALRGERWAEAQRAFGAALELAEELGRRRAVFECHEALTRLYKARGEFERALEHHEAFHRVERSVFNEENERRTRLLTVRFDLERARHETDRYRLRTELLRRAREEAEARVEARTRELREARLEVVNRLALAAEYRDDVTGEHTWRVGSVAGEIARELGWGEEEAELISAAARLHDVGKIGIRDALLLKPGRLDAREFEMMQVHTVMGARILSGGKSRLLGMAEEIALGHHERWDGGGYPHGLAGEAIPIAARIVAIADVWDALTHTRPYKRAWSRREALAEIRAQRGRQFDPRVVDAFLTVMARRADGAA